MQMYSDIPE
jgi:outer membrane receptor for ferrienterochelin and colicin